jgi:hypothetical protein
MVLIGKENLRLSIEINHPLDGKLVHNQGLVIIGLLDEI